MKPDFTDFERTLREDGKIEPYQGANPATGYPGDSKIYDLGILTIQIYRFSKVNKRTGAVLATNVPEIAVILPPEIAVGLVVQNQGGRI